MDRSHSNVRQLLDQLVLLRKEVPQKISDVHAKHNKQILQCLKDVKITLDSNPEYSNYSPELIIPFENLNLNEMHQFDQDLLDKIYKQIQFLQILILKKDCPISKIIDEI